MKSSVSIGGIITGKLQTAILIHCFVCQLLHTTSGEDMNKLYIGCFAERGSPGVNTDRVLQHQVPMVELTVDKCVEACRHDGYTFAGLQDGSSCWCGHNYYRKNSTQCDKACTGEQQKCGGIWINSIYSVCEEYHFGENCSNTCSGCKTRRCNYITGICLDDTDECADKMISRTCQQLCVNTDTSYECACKKGYNLKKDKLNCSAVNGIPPYAVMMVVLAILTPVAIAANLILIYINKVRTKKFLIKEAEREERIRREEEQGYMNPAHEINANNPDIQPHLYKKLAEGSRPISSHV